MEIFLSALNFSSRKSRENDFYLINLLRLFFARCGVGHGTMKIKGYLALGPTSVHVTQWWEVGSWSMVVCISNGRECQPFLFVGTGEWGLEHGSSW